MQEHKNNVLAGRTAFLITAVTIICLMWGSLPAFAETVVSIAPSSPTVQTNQNFSVYVSIEPETTFVGAQLNIDFDNSLIKASNVMEGELFGNEQILYIFNDGTIDNQAGTINGLYAVIKGGSQIDEGGIFTEVEFTSGDRTGYSDLCLSNVILSNSEGQAIPVTVESKRITIISSTNGKDPNVEKPESSSGSGGSDTSEDVGNIDLKEVKSVYVLSDMDISYVFNEQGNPVNSISYHSVKTAGQITSTIEVLKDTSVTVTDTPPGKVYRHINIWVGKQGYATEENIEGAVIGFSVPKEWLAGNGIDADLIRMNRFSEGKWNELETNIVGENTDSVLFEARTPGFSPFAITAFGTSSSIKRDNEVVLPDGDIDTDENAEVYALEEQGSITGEIADDTKKLGCNTLLLLMTILILIAILRKE
ncbi:PGF-pre-PGF domain-containing protein [Methanolobus halotolerans]|uniref:Cohesin domain-containing protein n=1 Tax=Methanolobus halotolerans TaxID=2052935 RepID=A0A4E0PV18_9EURY|nr:PGF-pre-PGF domain-containing protein [Methanolobus halotolerans]TGC07448.1 hypothetical protein CUN85_11160 [Methanolobus halotolerans]